MFRHIFKLIWNRKRSNALLISEIFFSFVVLFGVGTMLITYGSYYFSPHGFDPAPVWRLVVNAGPGRTMPRAELDDVMRQVRALPGVQAVALTSGNLPFTFSTMNSSYYNGKLESPYANTYDADDNYASAMSVQVREGRWFQPSDDGLKDRPVVITQDLRQALFGNGPAVGRTITGGDPSKQFNTDRYHIVGVAEPVRMDNDFSAATPSIWKRLVPHDTTHWETASVVLRVAPGQAGDLQEKIARTIAGVTRQWNTEVRTMSDDQRNKRRYALVPIIGFSLIGVFLIINVALGLFGVLWYNINQRRAEIGLRRAMGATGPAISQQFLGEMLVVTTLGVVLGSLIAAQFPLLNAFELAPKFYLAGIGAATVAVYAITALCAWQPSQLAAGIQPAVALRED